MRRAFLELLRPANVATSLADVLAGNAVAGLGGWRSLAWLLVSTAALYAGGVVLNDVFDRDIDRVERPERPIPSGRVTTAAAATLGTILLAAGLLAAQRASHESFLVALLLAGAILLYDAWGKRHPLFGPVNMGACRGLNLNLGMTTVAGAAGAHWPLGLIPLFYICAVTIVSRGEVTGGTRRAANIALTLHALVFGLLAGVAIARPGPMSTPAALLLTAFLAWRVWPAFWSARQNTSPAVIRNAVKTGVLSLVFLDAAIGAAYAGMIYSLAILATAVLAGRLARAFAVT